MRTVKMEIRGCSSPEKFDQVKEVLLARFNRLYQQGTEQALYLEYPSRDQAYADLALLNLLPGIKAKVLEFGG